MARLFGPLLEAIDKRGSLPVLWQVRWSLFAQVFCVVNLHLKLWQQEESEVMVKRNTLSLGLLGMFWLCRYCFSRSGKAASNSLYHRIRFFNLKKLSVFWHWQYFSPNTRLNKIGPISLCTIITLAELIGSQRDSNKTKGQFRSGLAPLHLR